METKKERIAYLTGRIDGIEDFAVWKDGEQYVGVMRRNLKDVLEPIRIARKALQDEVAKENK